MIKIIELTFEAKTEFEKGTIEEVEILQSFLDELNSKNIGNAKFAKKESSGKSIETLDWNQIIITLITSATIIAAKVIYSWITYKKERFVKIDGKVYKGYSSKEINEIEKSLNNHNN